MRGRVVLRGMCRAASAAVALATIVMNPAPAAALERLCDSSFENCRDEVLNRIRLETVEINVGAWFFEDARFTAELVRRFQAGVRVRILGEPRANAQHPLNHTLLQQMAGAGIPIRRKVTSGIEHWKLILFAGQNWVYFGSSNFSSDAFVPVDPFRNYVDETLYGTDDPLVVNSFKTRFDDAWVDVRVYDDYANAPDASAVRHYPIAPIDPALNFAPASGSSSYRSRSVAAYNRETQRMDIMMYRITDQAHVDALIAAFRRGIPIRIYTEQEMYRDPSQLWHSMSIDKLYMAGIPIKDRAHAGLNHSKVVLLYGQQLSIFGSSNMTSRSSDSQHEHNYFTNKADLFLWFVNQFERKWNNANPIGAPETKPFAPLPPDAPANRGPANAAVGVPRTGVSLSWYGGPWAHTYDLYFGTDPNPPLAAAGLPLGPSETTSQRQSIPLPQLAAATTYYWRIVSSTLANQSTSGRVFSFTTTGGTPPWEVPDPAVVDFNRDGLADLLWQRADGVVAAWEMAGMAASAVRYVQPALNDPNWRVASVGDFNLDGSSDLLWRNRASGELSVWFMTGTSMRSWSWLNPRIADPAWHLAGVGDFNRDGRADLLWQHLGDGSLVVWLMNGINAIAMPSLSIPRVADVNWRIQAIADFNLDSAPDLLWRHEATGELIIWIMDGVTVARMESVTPPRADLNWIIVGAADLNRDHWQDIVWRNRTDGSLLVWLMNGSAVMTWQPLAPNLPDLAWDVVAVH